MCVPFDLAPTARLPHIHMVGTVVRRFLISYPVAPEVLSEHVPPGAELAAHEGLAWVSACFVQVDHMRPNIFPKFAGMSFQYLIHRTRARLPFPDGKLREAVLVLEPNINRPLLRSLGSLLTGFGFRTRAIEFTEEDEHWRIRMASNDELLYDATIGTSSCSESIPAGSRFPTIQEAEAFLLGVSFGGWWVRGRRRLNLLPETHDRWTTRACTCVTHKNRFLEALGVDGTNADHVLTMTHVPHYFGVTPMKTVFG